MARDILAAALLTCAAAACMVIAWWGGARLEPSPGPQSPQTAVSEHQRPQ